MLPSDKAHVSQLLSLCSRVRELHLLSPCGTAAEAHTAWSPCSTREAHALQLESGPRSLQLEKSLHRSEDPVQPEINK